ncbi:MAG: hypothetical protein V4558_13370 [Gemmatimonadota bacterium]
MDPETIAFLKGVTVFVLVAGTALRAWRLSLGAREQRLEARERELVALVEEAQIARETGLQDELAELRAHLAELDDRVDFAERRLASERDAPPRIEPRHLTPV